MLRFNVTEMKNFNLIFFLALILFSCSNDKEIKPIFQDIEELVFASGQLEWDDAYNLTAQTDGVLENVNFEIGEYIKKGTIIATITNENNKVNSFISEEQLKIANQNLSENSPSLQQINENINLAESKYQQDLTQLQRYEKLYQTKSVSLVELENVQLSTKNSFTNLQQLKKQYENQLLLAKQQQIAYQGQVLNNKIMQDFNAIAANEAGTVIKKFKNNGDFVKKGDVIATLANANKIEAVLNVDETSIAKVKIGQTVYVQLNIDKNKIYTGTVSEILAAFDMQTQSFICKVVLQENVRSNFFGTQLEANISVGKKKNALLIPREYLGFGNMVNIKGEDNEIKVTTGIISTEYVEIIKGIKKNDVLIPLKLK